MDSTIDAIELTGNDKADLTSPQCSALTGGMPQERLDARVERFTVHDEGTADWYLGKLAGIDAEKARLKVQYDKRIAELSSDAASLTFKFGDQFRMWARAEADRRRRKTVTLPNGTASFRDVPGRFAFKQGADEEAFVHARTHCAECIVTASPKLDRAAYIALAEETGELFPGLETVAAREAFALKFPGVADTGAE